MSTRNSSGDTAPAAAFGAGRTAADPQRLQIRRMSSEDLDEVMGIEQSIYPFPWSRGNFRDSLLTSHDAWRFDDESGRMIGYAVLMWAPDEIHLLNLSLGQAYQGRGLGERLLRWLADDAHRRGAPALLLEVRPSNPAALRLYERVGMARIGLRRGYYPSAGRGREDAVVMRCPLPLAAPAGAGAGSSTGAPEPRDAG